MTERAKELLYAILGDRKHPATIAEEEGRTPDELFAEMEELEIEIPFALMPRDPRLVPTTRYHRSRTLDLATDGGRWLTPRDAAKVVGVTIKGLRGIAERDGIEVRWTDGGFGAGKRPKGGERRYKADDVHRVARERHAKGQDRDRHWWLKDSANQARILQGRAESGRWN